MNSITHTTLQTLITSERIKNEDGWEEVLIDYSTRVEEDCVLAEVGQY